jgi:hypothetical protein
MTTFPILEDLRAGAAFPGWRTQLMTFGQFVGGWDLAAEYYDAAGTCTYRGQWRWSFAWILDGRAIQDVIVTLGPAGAGTARTAAGTTVRYCDPATGRWTVYFLGVLSGVTTVLHGGRAGENIVLTGTDPDGTQNVWTFSDIRPDSFTWTGRESADGITWWQNQRMLAIRRR